MRFLHTYRVFTLVEARGVEPLSENRSIQLSPSKVYRLNSLLIPPTDRLKKSVSAVIHQAQSRNPAMTFTTNRRLFRVRGPTRTDGRLN